MAKLTWDESGSRIYETGTRRGVLYKKIATGTEAGNYGIGVPWNGLTGVTESPSGAEETALYADDIKYLSLYSAEEFGGTIEAYTYPDEWAECDGSKVLGNGVAFGQQPRKSFGLCYRTEQGNDVDSNIDDGYKIHLVYNCTASPSDRQYETINDSPDAITFSWEYTSNPVAFTVQGAVDANLKPVSCITIDTKKILAAQDGTAKLEALEAKLYGDGSKTAVLPTPDEVYTWATTGSFPA